MPCRIVSTDRGAAMVCTRDKRVFGKSDALCTQCGRFTAEYLCDGPTEDGKSTCDKPLCGGCAIVMGPDRHFCEGCCAEERTAYLVRWIVRQQCHGKGRELHEYFHRIEAQERPVAKIPELRERCRVELAAYRAEQREQARAAQEAPCPLQANSPESKRSRAELLAMVRANSAKPQSKP